jgi:hypothetical protein
MNFLDLIWEVPNALPDDLCDELVRKFEEDEEHRYQGESGAGLDLNIKNSTELHLSSEGWEDLDTTVFETVTKHTDQYLELLENKLRPDNKIHRMNLADSGYQIQKSAPSGQYVWHHDAMTTGILDGTYYNKEQNKIKVLMVERVATFIYYLNDSSDFVGGRTQFYFGDEVHSVVPKKGLCVWFPASNLYTHRGEMVESGDKYLLTGWIHEEYYMPGKFHSTTSSKMMRDTYDKPEEFLFPLCDTEENARTVVGLSTS